MWPQSQEIGVSSSWLASWGVERFAPLKPQFGQASRPQFAWPSASTSQPRSSQGSSVIPHWLWRAFRCRTAGERVAVELGFLGGAGEGERRGLAAADDGCDVVEVAGADLSLVAGGGVA